MRFISMAKWIILGQNHQVTEKTGTAPKKLRRDADPLKIKKKNISDPIFWL